MAREWTESRGKDRNFTVTVARPSQCKRVLSIEIAREELEREEVRVLEKIRRDLKIPGFRRGKVPTKYIERNFADEIHNDAVRNLLPDIYQEAIARENISPIGDPKFENLHAERGQDIRVDIAVEVRPEITVKGYRGMSVEVKRREVGEKDVEEALNHLRERMATLRVVDRKIREGDFVVIDYGPLLEGGEIDKPRYSRNYTVDLNSDALLKEFREGLLGMELREEKDIHVRYPSDFPNEEMAGTEKTFRVTIKEIKEKHLPELNDEFARHLGERFSRLEDLREQVRADLVEEEEKRRQRAVEDSIIDQLIKKNPFEVPETMVENYLASILKEDKRRRPTVPDDAEREREVREHFHDAAVKTIKRYFILEAIKRQEDINVDEQEIKERIDKIAAGGGERAGEIRRYFHNPERKRNLKDEVLDEKVLTFLRENADVKAA